MTGDFESRGRFMRTVPLDAKQVRKVADYLIREKEDTFLQKSEEPKRQYSVKRRSRYSIDSEKRSAAKREIIDFLQHPETMEAHKKEIIDMGRFSPHVVNFIRKKSEIEIDDQSMMQMHVSDLIHIAAHKDLSEKQIADLVEVFDAPDDIGFIKGQKGNKIWFFKNIGNRTVAFGVSLFGRRSNVGWVKTFFHVDDKQKYIDSKGIHVETVANSVEQSKDRPDAAPALIGSTWMPSEGTITQSDENASEEFEKTFDAVRQKFGSGNTSLRQVAAGFRKIDFQPGTVNLDLGGGKFDEGTKYLAEKGVRNLIFDPVNREADHNRMIFDAVRQLGVDTVTCNNVLNVIQEPEARSNVILQAAKALKPGGTAYFTVYEGDRTGNGRQSQADAWQENRKTNDYLDEVREHFASVIVKDKVIIARDPIIEGKTSAWAMDATFENPRQYSFKKHDQVNPIRRPGDVKTQHQAIIDQPYEPKSNATLNLQARRRIVALGGFDGAIRTMLDGDFTVGSDVSERVLQLVLNSDEFARLNADSRAVISELYVKHFGTEIGRALAARRLGVLDLGDILSIQAHVNALMAKIGKEKPNSRLREEILDEFGIDIDSLPEEVVHTPKLLDELIRRMLAGRASVFDKAYEFWINSILSAPTTHAANTLGNTANAVYELGDADPDQPTDPAEAVRFSFGRDLHFPRRRVY